MLIGPRHSRDAPDSRAPREWRAPMSVFSRGEGVPRIVDSWPKTLVPSASKRSTPSGLLWTLLCLGLGLLVGHGRALLTPRRRLFVGVGHSEQQRCAEGLAGELDRDRHAALAETG